MMIGLEAFLLAYLASVIIGCFAEGLWGKRLSKAGYVSPFVVSTLWPFGLFLGVVALPFVLAFAVGRWISLRAALSNEGAG